MKVYADIMAHPKGIKDVNPIVTYKSTRGTSYVNISISDEASITTFMPSRKDAILLLHQLRAKIDKAIKEVTNG